MSTIGLLQACEDAELFNVKLHPVQRQVLEELEASQHAVISAGRRGGKTMLASIVALHDCLFNPAADALVRRGEVRYVVAVCVNQESAKILLRSAALIVDQSELLRERRQSSSDSEMCFELPDGSLTALRAFPCSSRGLRGYPISCGVQDEAAFFVNTEDGDKAAAEVFKALQPAVVQFGAHGRMLIISSAAGSEGFFAERWARASSGELDGWTALQYSTAELNPDVPAEYLEQAERDEPATFPGEYLGQFEAGGSQFIDTSRIELVDDYAAPGAAAAWTAGCDPAVTSDSWGLALVGRTIDGRLIVGPVLAIEPKRKRQGWSFEDKRRAQDRVLERVAEVCKQHGARAVSDQFESVAVQTRLRELGVAAGVRGMNRDTKLAAFRELRDRLYDGSLRLPNDQTLLRELARVQIKLSEGGAKIILPRSSKGHLDRVQALALAVYEQRFAGTTQAINTVPAVRPITAGMLNSPPGDPTPTPAARPPTAGGRDPDKHQSAEPPPGWPGAKTSIRDMDF